MPRKLLIVLLLGIDLLIVSAIAVWLYLSQQPNRAPSVSLSSFRERMTVSTNNDKAAFIELTIPYLRQQSYQSNLGDLELYAENGSYRSYLTSYTSEGIKINGLLTVPTGAQPVEGWPAIVFIHGYIPPTQYQTTARYQDYVNYLARNGLVVFKIDLRGHGQSEGQAGGAYYSADYVIDTLNARAALAAASFVDGNKIGLWGHSMAGNVVLRAVAAQPEIPAAVIWAGAGFTYEDLRQYGIDDGSYRPPAQDSQRQRRRQELFATYGDFDPTHEFWRQVIPTNYLTDFTGAIQLHHAANDPTVTIEYSRNLDQILSQQNISHQLHEYTTGGHDLEGASFGLAMQRTVEFFRDHLTPK